MATTPKPITWQFSKLRATSVDNTGAALHYFSEDAQSIYLKGGLVTKLLDVEQGHFEYAEEHEEDRINASDYKNLEFNHASMGDVWGSAITDDTLYLLRYTYAKDISNIVDSASWSMNTDNPISQLSANLMNIDYDMFTKETSLFLPTAKVIVGMYMGDSEVMPIGNAYLDEINIKYGVQNISISGRNSIGYLLNDQTFDVKSTYEGSASEIIETIFEAYGIDKYVIEPNSTSIKYPHEASDTLLKGLQEIADMISDSTQTGATWGYEETAEGVVVCGYDEFRSRYLAKGHYKFGESELFMRSTLKNIDGAYSRVYVQGENSDGKSLTPVIKSVRAFPYWSVSKHKTFFATPLKDATQEQLEVYAETLATQLQFTGSTESYDGPIRPQLLVGDVADVKEGDDYRSVGTITEITHVFGRRGFKTSFTVDSGGDATDVGTKVYSNSRRNNGNNRKKRITDFLGAKVTSTEIVKTLGFTPVSTNAKGQAGGIAPLGADGKIPAEYIAGAEDIELAKLKDVKISNPQDNQGLVYDANTSLWKNKKISSLPLHVIDGILCCRTKK